MVLTPLNKRVLLKVSKSDEKTSSGLFIPQTAQEKTQTGSIIAVATDADSALKVNQTVMYDKYAGTSVTINNEDHLIVKSEDIVAIVN